MIIHIMGKNETLSFMNRLIFVREINRNETE